MRHIFNNTTYFIQIFTSLLDGYCVLKKEIMIQEKQININLKLGNIYNAVPHNPMLKLIIRVTFCDLNILIIYSKQYLE